MSKYGEPWNLGGDDCHVVMKEGAATFWPASPDEARRDGESWLAMRERTEPERAAMFKRCAARTRRSVACVNACAGIDDPQAAIYAAREALDGVFSGHTDYALVAKAVRLLGPKP